MEVYSFLLCCLIFTTAAAVSVFDEISELAKNDSLQELAKNESLQEIAGGSRCRCENGRCVTDNRGKTKCACRPGYSALDDHTCKPCDCGALGKCIFVLLPDPRHVLKTKKCVCDLGSAEKDGVCENCYCGENSACEYDGLYKNCYCIDGYAEKDGVCTRCDCGFYGKCEFDGGNKRCECDSGYLELNGYCNECDCGEHGSCSFINGEKTCQCESGYSVKDGTCETCYCGPNAIKCGFYNGVKQCACQQHYADRFGVCEECGCGVNSYGCIFSKNGDKNCQCTEGYVQKGEECEAGCNLQRPCRNGGQCNNGFCSCLPGTQGDFCEIIVGCETECPNRQDVGCGYDVNRQKPYCFCHNSPLKYDVNDKQCKKSCDPTRRCLNGGACNTRDGILKHSFCDCLPGTTGDYCENIPECAFKNCGKDAQCTYDPHVTTAVCTCNDPNKSFDPATTTCKRTCNDNSQCQNGGICSPSGSAKFCQCKKGTEGDFCELVPGCAFLNCGSFADCKYDVQDGKAACKCKVDGLYFDERDTLCKKTCDDDRTCHNYGKCDGGPRYRFCHCLDGTYGQFCEDIVGCDRLNCGNDAYCTYNVQTKGPMCTCRNPALSFDPAAIKCKQTCEVDGGCKNGGKCVGGFCVCPEGTVGDKCEIVPECSRKDCGPDARCDYNVDRKSAVCVCNDRRYSYDEASRTCKRACSLEEECRNGGNCVPRGFDRFCDCPPGTKGDLCEIVDDCQTGRVKCGNGAYCEYDAQRQKAVCSCPDQKKRYDTLTQECKLPCCEEECYNGGRCEPQGDFSFCRCRNGTRGNLCEIVDDCVKGLCGTSNTVECHYDVTTAAGKCVCKNSEHEYDSVHKECKECDCGTNALSCRIQNGLKTCACPDGYKAIGGFCKKVRCTDNRCMNGRCDVDDNEKEICTCYEGYELVGGNYCQRLNCTKTPCLNGTCVVRKDGSEECICQAGYSLRSGACIRGSCRIDTCFGGRCEVHDGELMCVCPKGYSLQGIGCFATVCKEKHCFGGVCVVNEQTKEENCTCYDGYVLINDVCKKIICHKPCFGGVCQVMGDGREVCVCPDDHSVYPDGICRKDRARRSQTVWETVKSYTDWTHWLSG